jgi:hypothetical protein
MDSLSCAPGTLRSYLSGGAALRLLALGFGIYRPQGLVQMFDEASIWPRIGYEVTGDVRATLRGVRRAIGVAPARKAPVLAEQARAMALIAPESLKGLRDRALLLLGFRRGVSPVRARGVED